MLPALDPYPNGTGSQSRQAGRALPWEIQRLIGRSLRAAIDLKALGEHTIRSMRRVAAMAEPVPRRSPGGFVALSLAVQRHAQTQTDQDQSAARAGRLGFRGHLYGVPVLDLDYAEDSNAETDMNVVMNDAAAFIEVQGTAEGHAFRKEELDAMLELAGNGIKELLEKQRVRDRKS